MTSYRENNREIPYHVRDIKLREFTFFFKSGEKWNEHKQVTEPIIHIKRQITFNTQDDLWDYIDKKKPLHSYFSNAYFTFPEHAPSDRAFWNGTDLFFDFDSKDNVKLARAEAELVYDALQDMFGIDDVEMVFSGSKGYHVIAYGNRDDIRMTHKLRNITSQERREIVDFFKLSGDEKIHRRFPPLLTLDPEPTIDIHRLRRLPGSIHGGSGERCRVIKSTC
jgi:DNA primase catalytic subunit